MPFQSVPGVCEATVNFLTNGVSIQNTFHAQLVGYNTDAIVDLAGAIAVIIEEDWRPILPSAISYVSVEVRGLELQNDISTIAIDGAGPGAVATGELPLNVTKAIRRTSSLSGRSARGRVFWPLLHNAQLASNGNFINQTDADNMVAAVAAVRVAIPTAGFAPVIVSRYNNGEQRLLGVTFPWVGTSVTNLSIDSRRDRLPA